MLIDEVYEGDDGGVYCIGRTEGDAHEVDNQVRFPYDDRIGEAVFTTVHIEEADAYDLFGVPVFTNA